MLIFKGILLTKCINTIDFIIYSLHGVESCYIDDSKDPFSIACPSEERPQVKMDKERMLPQTSFLCALHVLLWANTYLI